MSTYNLVFSSNESTVVTEYKPQAKRSDEYQSEASLEAAFIKMLTEQGYELVSICDEKSMINNLRKQIELLNNYNFTDSEWKYFFENNIANKNEGIVDKTKKIHEDNIQVLKCDNGTIKNICLIDKMNIHNNKLQVINQYEEDGGKHKTRYDVTILVNGLPLIHLELKRRGVAIKEAFNQINRYQRDSFWAGSGLYEYVQIFVISNGTNTKYYSNTTRISHVEKSNGMKQNVGKKTSNSFEFTSYWADGNNNIISDLVDFTKTFFSKHTILNILTKYCIFTTDELLLVMRPYQIVATERILNRIEISTNYNKVGTIDAGGYIWHTTGSGKTLTSFKTAQLATSLPYINKVIFVVDRKDLDYQTIKEYDKFEKGAANSNTNTAILQKQLEDNQCRIIVTTIQKLDIFIKKNKTHPIYNKHLVIIFDECHRSQFGEMHHNITKYFKNYHIFGFTGTPIFAVNSGNSKKPNLRTTEQAFGDKLHIYSIVDAINDGNVLPFKIDYVNTIKSKENEKDKQVSSINTEEVIGSKERIETIVKYILENFNDKTMRNSCYNLNGQRVNGFNSMFAVSSIPMCKKYYLEFKKQIKEQHKDLTIATIFSFAPNEEDSSDGILDDEKFDTNELDKSSRDFLDMAIDDYNNKFNTRYDSSSNGFQNYYKDLSLRLKNREVDLVIVVNMFLTGFDATTLNTLWVDKNLKMHGLIQAFSRTNRILNSVKSFGNIVCFRNLEQETNEAIALFGNKDAKGIVLLKTYEDYYYGFTDNKGIEQIGYEELVEKLLSSFPLKENIIGEQNEKEFISLFGKILKLRNILSAFDNFKGNEILKPIDFQDYTGTYNDLYEKYKRPDTTKDSILDDVVFEIELVKQVEVNIDYILMLVKKYYGSNCKDKEIIGAINKAIMSSFQLRSKKELIEEFINSINTVTDIDSLDINYEWEEFIRKQYDNDIDDIIKEETLKGTETIKFIENCLYNGVFRSTGTEVDNILPPISRFGRNKENNRQEKKQYVISKLSVFFEKYLGLINKID